MSKLLKKLDCRLIIGAIMATGLTLTMIGTPTQASDIDKIHFLIPGGAGGGWDGTARGTGEALTKSGIVGSASSRFAPARSLNQNISQAADNFFRINGLNGWTNFMREGAVFMMANDLRRALSKNYNELNSSYRRIMSQYNIGEKDWDMLKKVPADLFGDKRLLTPDKIKYSPIQRQSNQ